MYSSVPPRFGAYYATLPYHGLWNSMWRPSKYEDLVTNFGQMPVSMVFWRGISYGTCWITDNERWISDQSAEIGGPMGCAEHMGDKEARFTHVRLIENNPARIVVHWRHACADIGYNFRHSKAWSDEYHTIYPDGVSITGYARDQPSIRRYAPIAAHVSRCVPLPPKR